MDPRLDLPIRPRRNRRNASIRDIIAETGLAAQHLVMPLFVMEGSSKRQAIGSMPGIFRTSLDLALRRWRGCRSWACAASRSSPT